MNVYDSSRMEDVLSPLGYETTKQVQDADMVIMNTCHIREKATEKVFSDLGRLYKVKQSNPDLIIAVAGCVAQAEGEEITRRAPYVDLVFGPQAYQNLPKMLAQLNQKRQKQDPSFKALDIDFPTISKFDSLPEQTKNQNVSAFLSIQEGCDKFCTFCVVPYTRGAEFSRSVEEITHEATRLVELGAKEITLLGQNVNAYHGKSPDNASDAEWGLGKLIEHLAKIGRLERIRYTTSHPIDMDDELIQAHGHVEKLMPFLHLPVQSGSDYMLKAMQRKHDIAFYYDVIDKLRKAQPNIAFSSDFIVGFPGESDKDFHQTMDLVRQVDFAQAFSFKYSPRLGTPASLKDIQVPEEIKKERLLDLQSLLTEQQLAFNKSKIGMILPVLFEKRGKETGQLVGRTEFMQLVHASLDEEYIGSTVDIHVTESGFNSLKGGILWPEEKSYQVN